MRKQVLAVGLSLGLVLASAVGCATKKANTATTDAPKDTVESVAEKIDVVTTIFPPYDFTREIGKDNVNVTMLLKPGAESHTYEPTPNDIKLIQECDLFIYTGGENDVWVDKILESIDTSKVKTLKMVDAVDTVEEEIVEGMEHEHHHEDGDHDHEHEDGDHDHEHEDGDHDHEHEDGDHDHEHEDGDHDHEHEDGDHDHEHEDGDHDHDGHHHHHEMDEHVWTSPKNAILIANAIKEQLKSIDSANAAVYDTNAAAYVDELTQLDKDYTDMITASAKKTIVVADRFPFRYLADAYGIKYYAAFTGCSADTEAKPTTIAFLIDKVKEEGIKTVFTIEMSNGKLADSVCEATGAKREMLHSAHNLNQDEINSGLTYIKLMQNNLAKLKEALN